MEEIRLCLLTILNCVFCVLIYFFIFLCDGKLRSVFSGIHNGKLLFVGSIGENYLVKF